MTNLERVQSRCTVADYVTPPSKTLVTPLSSADLRDVRFMNKEERVETSTSTRHTWSFECRHDANPANVMLKARLSLEECVQIFHMIQR